MISTTVRRWALAGTVAIFGLLALGRSVDAASLSVLLSPTSGQPGATISARISGFKANEDIQIIFRSPGNPVVARGSTDGNGVATLTFKVPQTISGVYDVFIGNMVDNSCDVVVPFTVIPGPPATATPTQAPPTVAPPPVPTTAPPPPPPPTAGPPPVPTATPIAVIPATPIIPQSGDSLSGNLDGQSTAATGFFFLGAMFVIVSSLGIMKVTSVRKKSE